MEKIWRAISSTLAVLITLTACFGAGYYVGRIPANEVETMIHTNSSDEFDFQLPAEDEKRIVTVDEIEVELVDISQFSSYSGEYTVTRSAEYTRYFLDNIVVPGTTNEVTIECQGLVKVGYEVEDIDIKVDNDSQKIYISLPDPKVLDNYIIWDTVKCQEVNNILNPIDFEQYRSLIAEIKADGLKITEGNGIYDNAADNIKNIIRHFLCGFDDFEIIFM